MLHHLDGPIADQPDLNALQVYLNEKVRSTRYSPFLSAPIMIRAASHSSDPSSTRGSERLFRRRAAQNGLERSLRR
jgi:hypothetical protein